MKGDIILFPIEAILSLAGLIVILRLLPQFAVRRFIWLFTGLVGFIADSKGPK